jgi:hypothetical protein
MRSKVNSTMQYEPLQFRRINIIVIFIIFTIIDYHFYHH